MFYECSFLCCLITQICEVTSLFCSVVWIIFMHLVKMKFHHFLAIFLVYNFEIFLRFFHLAASLGTEILVLSLVKHWFMLLPLTSSTTSFWHVAHMFGFIEFLMVRYRLKREAQRSLLLSSEVYLLVWEGNNFKTCSGIALLHCGW